MSDLIPFFLITVLLLVVAIGIIMLVLVYQKKQLQNLRDKEQLKVSFEKEILESKLEIQEQTFKNISLEIHDNIGQVLSLVKLTLNTVDCREPEILREKIGHSEVLLGKAIQDLRDLAKSFNSDMISQQGLVKSIEYEFEMIRKTGKFETILKEEGDSFRLSHQHELILFRIFQEAINNIIKHSEATVITILFSYLPDRYSFQVTDNGQGFDLASISKDCRPGMGIANIKNRTRIIGAECIIESDPGKGTVIQVSLPIPDSAIFTNSEKSLFKNALFHS